MVTILEALKSVSGYPVEERTFVDVATKRGLNLEDEATADALGSAPYRLARADVMRWVSFAPNVRQADVQFDLLYSDRVELRRAANSIYGELGDAEYIPEKTAKFGYKGSRL